MNQQLRFFNPDNPPQAFSKAESNAKVNEIKADMAKDTQDRWQSGHEIKHALLSVQFRKHHGLPLTSSDDMVYRQEDQ